MQGQEELLQKVEQWLKNDPSALPVIGEFWQLKSSNGVLEAFEKAQVMGFGKAENGTDTILILSQRYYGGPYMDWSYPLQTFMLLYERMPWGG